MSAAVVIAAADNLGAMVSVVMLTCHSSGGYDANGKCPLN